jgi:subtilisin family serine protease
MLYVKIFAKEIMLSVLITGIAYSQSDSIVLNGITYRKDISGWFMTKEGARVATINPMSIIVKMKYDAALNGGVLRLYAPDSLVRYKTILAGRYHWLAVNTADAAFSIANSLQRTGLFSDIFFEVLYETHSEPNDALHYPFQWYLGKIQADTAWNICRGDSSIIVAIIDGGTEYNHEDLIGNKWIGTGYDFYHDDPDPYPEDSAKHGTPVAGIVGASTNNSMGVSGIAGGWNGNGVKLMHLQAGYQRDSLGVDYYRVMISTVAATIATDSAVAWGARVINMSFGDPNADFEPLQIAINNAVTHNVVVVASAGNYFYSETNPQRWVCLPARYDSVIAVGATTQTDLRKQWESEDGKDWGSCYGDELDIVAPGVDIWTTDLTDSLGYSWISYTQGTFGGTSAAAPMVAGVAALVLSLNGNLSSFQVKNTILLSADKVTAMGDSNFAVQYGYGRLNAYKAVRNLYVPMVYPTVDSAFSHTHQGQAIVLQKDSGAQATSINLDLKAQRTLEIMPNASLVIRDTLEIDSAAVITLMSDASGPAKIVFETGGYLRLKSATSLQGKGIIENAKIHWESNFQVGPADSMEFKYGGELSFCKAGSNININGALIFDSGRYIFLDSIATIYLGSGDYAVLETKPGAVLDSLPDIVAYVPSHVLSNCTDPSPCEWNFRFLHKCDIYYELEAQYTTYQGVADSNGSHSKWQGILLGYDSSTISFNHCTVQDIHTNDTSFHGNAIYLYGSSSSLNNISHCQINSFQPEAYFAGDGIIVQAGFQNSPRSKLRIDNTCISRGWWTGLNNACSDVQIQQGRFYLNFQGMAAMATGITHLYESCITLNQLRGIYLNDGSHVVLSTNSGSPSYGRNTIAENGPNPPSAYQFNQGQIVVENSSMVNDDSFTYMQGNNIISHQTDTVKRVYLDDFNSLAYLPGNWWGQNTPAGCGVGSYGYLDSTMKSDIFVDPVSCIDSDSALCVKPELPGCDSTCDEGIGAMIAVPPTAHSIRGVTPGSMRKSSALSTPLQNALAQASVHIGAGDPLGAYGALGPLLTGNVDDATASIAGYFLLRMELRRMERYPDSIEACMTRLAIFCDNRIGNVSNAIAKAALREILAYAYAHAGDLQAAAQVINTIEVQHGSTRYGRRILPLKQLVAMARRDTVTVDRTIADMRTSGYDMAALRTAYALRAGFLRVLPRSSTMTKPRIPVAERGKATIDQKDRMILRNYPNPFNPSTILEYVIQKESRVRIDVYNSVGTRLCRFDEGIRKPGRYTLEFKPGAGAPTGVYLCVMTTDYGSVTRRMLYVK